ncbi:Protein O-mannosyltransferase 2 [Coemansia sp. RSA 1939]|nr:Protein O-mannosyltransferase 2 [Coemansia sp. RSA 1939]KAJ2610237.1 Protein O-mannosyltransferase 2 [Coemansia sp. RSA 1804]KAJ2693984.1 Protein O-mannosyltransferase 2 [Coemansia sp. RSA 1285]
MTMVGRLSERQAEITTVALLTILSAAVRLWDIGRVDTVVWDEAHFGRFGAMYLNGTYIHDVHPPLGKLIIAAAEYVAGANGSRHFDFVGGAKYPDSVDYRAIRMQVSAFGILLAPLAYLTLRIGLDRRSSAILGAWFVIFDNALCLMTRIIVLDGPLLCFTALTMATTVLWLRLGQKRWMAATGVALGLTVSVKWTGLFTMLLVGILTAMEISYRWLAMYKQWTSMVMMNHPSGPAKTTPPAPAAKASSSRHLLTLLALLLRLARLVAVRALFLIAVPALVYIAVYRIHFAMQTVQGLGEQKMPIRFQANLRWNRYNRQPTSVAYNGSIAKLWLDEDSAQGKMLAFRPRSEEEISSGSGNSNIAWRRVGYGSANTGVDWWSFMRPAGAEAKGSNDEFLCDGCLVELIHDTTQMRMQVGTPISTGLENGTIEEHPVAIAARQEDISNRSAKENSITATEKDDSGAGAWIVEIVSQEVPALDDGFVHPISTVFRLRHKATNCTLSRHRSKRINSQKDDCRLPASAPSLNVTSAIVCSRQEEEATPRKVKDKSSDNGRWRIEYHVHWAKGFDNNMQGKVRTSFVENLVAQTRIMAEANADLAPADPDRFDILASKPWTWPFLLSPMRMSKWDRGFVAKHPVVVYEVGNPLLWWLSGFVCVVVYPLRLASACVRARRESALESKLDGGMVKARRRALCSSVLSECSYNRPLGWMLWLGWALHYFPFFAMRRVTYLHHYLAALYFALLLLALELGSVRKRASAALGVAVAAAAAAVFYCYRPCTYGWQQQQAATDLAHLKALGWWNIAGSPHDC